MIIENLIADMRNELREMQQQADKAKVRIEVWEDVITRLEAALVRAKAGADGGKTQVSELRACYTCLHYYRRETDPPCDECFGSIYRPNWEPGDA